MAHVVLTECPAPAHNSLRAAMGRRYKAAPSLHCVCPHSLELREQYNVRQGVRRKGRVFGTGLAAISEVNASPIPLMVGAACGSRAGKRAHDEAIDKPNTVKAILAAKEYCDGCPIIDECRRWVLAAEISPGSWGGVYGGLSVKDRRVARAHRAV